MLPRDPLVQDGKNQEEMVVASSASRRGSDKNGLQIAIASQYLIAARNQSTGLRCLLCASTINLLVPSGLLIRYLV